MAGTIGKLVHYSFDLALISVVFAGVKKNTGLTPKINLINQPEVENIANQYLLFGEKVYDYTVGSMSGSSYFQRK